MTLSRLSLRWVPSSVGEGKEVEVLIDGVNLLDLARAWETTHTPEPGLAGGYVGVQHWEADFLQHGFALEPVRVNLLECGCGVWGCWPLQAQVTREGERVIWSEFVQPHRRASWSYDGFGPFVFSAEQYEAQVRGPLKVVQGESAGPQ
ncbi:hypothetical protein L1280_002274 [Deinococcus sp. HSC-46F16]|nr:hypothetical protein [Deinococcus sp. HSC-46F16]